ncbi:MAG: crotonase/enoyl-CoA hydratase family protein [Acidobacteria bacterium]|nr:crotonase/enoyl-CoA hydratase family protein [Acidobacteriota bacterium]MBI3656360.1 crotonase/enoyl-CoA hydratase family protein [Acidobacteriota bacterium]
MIKVEKAGPVSTIILDRPYARNAIDAPTARALADAFRDFDAEASALVAVLWGAGGNFCAGADLKAMGTDRVNVIQADGDGPLGPTRLLLRKPVIAAVAGYAVAGGLELALWCDLRVAEQDAVFGVFCRRWGVPLMDGGTVRLPRLIGLSRALDMILTGRPVTATEALAMGLANRVVPNGQSRAEAEALAREIAVLPQDCLRNDRAAAVTQFGLPLDEALKMEYEIGLRSLASPQLTQGIARFQSGQGRHGSFE